MGFMLFRFTYKAGSFMELGNRLTWEFVANLFKMKKHKKGFVRRMINITQWPYAIPLYLLGILSIPFLLFEMLTHDNFQTIMDDMMAELENDFYEASGEYTHSKK